MPKAGAITAGDLMAVRKKVVSNHTTRQQAAVVLCARVKGRPYKWNRQIIGIHQVTEEMVLRALGIEKQLQTLSLTASGAKRWQRK